MFTIWKINTRIFGQDLDSAIIHLTQRHYQRQENYLLKRPIVKREDYNEIGSILDLFLFNSGGGNIIIEGDSGVGKTTFIYYHKLIWKLRLKQFTWKVMRPIATF